MLGTLGQFLEMQELSQALPSLANKEQYQYDPTLKKNDVLERKYKVPRQLCNHTRIHSYSHNNHQAEYINAQAQYRGSSAIRKKQELQVYREQLRRRRKIIDTSSLFPKKGIKENTIGKQHLKRKHSLLRAVARTYENDVQSTKQTQYNRSYNRLYQRLSDITKKGKEELRPEHHSHPAAKLRPSPLRNQQRIQFQNCLVWAKRHKKNEGYYAQRLGQRSSSNQRAVKKCSPTSAMLSAIAKQFAQMSTPQPTQ